MSPPTLMRIIRLKKLPCLIGLFPSYKYMQWPEKHDYGFQLMSPTENQFDGTWHEMMAIYPNFLKEEYPYLDWQG